MLVGNVGPGVDGSFVAFSGHRFGRGFRKWPCRLSLTSIRWWKEGCGGKRREGVVGFWKIGFAEAVPGRCLGRLLAAFGWLPGVSTFLDLVVI